MERKYLSDTRKSALGVLTFAFLVQVVAFFTPYWLASDRRHYGAEFDKLGLWETCFRSLKGPNDLDYTKYYSGCRWIFFYDYRSIRSFLMPPFFIFTQIFFTIGFVLLLIAVIGVLAIQLCFVIKKEIYAMKVLAIDLSVSAFCCTLAVIMFGIYGDDADWMPDRNFLSWSYSLAVIGTFFSWVAAVLFWIENRILYKKQFRRPMTYAIKSSVERA